MEDLPVMSLKNIFKVQGRGIIGFMVGFKP
jgi:hypothetical protein